MKVKDLIKVLQTYDPELEVSIDGYEGGVTDSFVMYNTDVYIDAHEVWYKGEHLACTDVITDAEKERYSECGIEQRLILQRKTN